MQLIIADKLSIGMSLAAVLGARHKKDCYSEDGVYIVFWCVGHLIVLTAYLNCDTLLLKGGAFMCKRF